MPAPTGLAHLSLDEYRRIEKRMLWKIDVQVTLIVTILYLLSFLDRVNISQARQLGIMQQLRLSAHDYSVALTVLYAPYVFFEIPCNLLLKKVGPARLIPGLVISWGIVATLQGIVKTRTGLFINRCFLGFAEAGILPGIIIYLTFFFRPSELQFRQALYFSGASLAGAFGALISAAVSPLHAAGLQPWSWLFILEGIVTVLFGVACIWILPNGPANLKGLTEVEKEIALDRVSRASRHSATSMPRADKGLDAQPTPPAAKSGFEHMAGKADTFADSAADPSSASALTPEDDRGNAELEEHLESFRREDVFRTIRDPFVLLLAVAHFCQAVGVYSLAFFAPTVIKGLNLGAGRGKPLTLAESLLLVTPPFVLAFFVSLGMAVVADKYRWRGPAYIATYLLAIIGFAMAYGGQGKPGVQYAGIMILAAGDYSGPSVSLSWISIGTASHYKRATAAALMIVFTNSGGIASTWLWNGATSTGFLVNLILHIVGLFVVVLLELYVLWDRSRRGKEGSRERKLLEESAAKWPGATQEQLRELLGDEHPEFRLEL
ncbi:unnamed protein product [Parajaminaea phylloscopi]